MMNTKVSVIIPAYNEAESIKTVLECVKDIKHIDEIIVVDDGSTDNTFSIAKTSGITVIKHPYNKGYSASLKTGIRNAKNEHVVVMDADGQHDPGDIEKIIKPLNEYEMVVGCRSKGSHVSVFRKPGKLVLHWLANYISGFKIPDLNSGFRAFKKSKVMEFMHILPNTFSFSTTITMAFYKAGYSIKYVPIVTDRRKGGKSRVKQVRHGLQTILLIIRVIMLFNPLKVYVPIAFILFLFGFLFSIYGIIRFHRFPGTGITTILSGIIIFFFGILADQIAALRMEKYKE